MHCIV